MKILLLKFLFYIIYLLFSSFFAFNYLFPLFQANSVIFPYAIHPFDLCIEYPSFWENLKKIYIFLFLSSNTILYFAFYRIVILPILEKFYNKKTNYCKNNLFSKDIHLHVGNNENNYPVIIPKKGLFQNFLITGTIGSGKTSSALYPFLKQLMSYNLPMLVLDVKGNFYKQVHVFANSLNRTKDIITIDLSGKIKYNPLDKPNLKPIVLANQLKTILTLFSTNNGESYWLDKAEQILSECIKLCRLYNNNYVTFEEIHKLVMEKEYYLEKISFLQTSFRNGLLSKRDIYNLLSSINFFEKEFFSLDSRTSSILKSEISRITNTFVSDFDVKNCFCPSKNDVNFHGFSSLLNSHKIVVLNLNISEYRNLSKIISAYLKLDFQTEILSRLAKNPNNIVPSVFICDEYQNFVTSTDADFFSQSRESKCINIVATQSYSSLLNTLKDSATLKVLIQSLVNKLWLRTDDIFTIEEAQKQLGKEYKELISTTISENAKETHFNYITNKFTSIDSNLSESINTSHQKEYSFETNSFSLDLETFSCIAFLSDGTKIMKPCKIKLLPYFKERS